MQTILGPFHPFLERALVGNVRDYKNRDALAPLLVLVPSDSLRRRLKTLLAREERLDLLNLHILTFHQLSLRLCEEASGRDRPDLADDLFLEEVLRQLIQTGRPGTEAFRGIEERLGGCAALWQTLRDLKDGMVDPSSASEALSEGHLGKDRDARIANLLDLFDAFLSFCGERNIQDYADVDRLATSQAGASRFLKSFVRVFYYGFYDLTQVQLDLFHAVAQNHPTTHFFPLLHTAPGHPGWAFAERFYQRYVRGTAGDALSIENLAAGLEPRSGVPPALRLFDEQPQQTPVPMLKPWSCQIFSAFGARDEVATAAKEILRLVDDEGVTYEEIGVVARSLDGYASFIKNVFRDHRIPTANSAEEPLVQWPLAKAAVLFVNLPWRDYRRSHLIDLVSSPYFRPDAGGSGTVRPRPDLWDLLTRRLGISKGMDAWRRLQKYSERDLIFSEGGGEENPKVIRIAAAQIRALAALVENLYRDFAALPRQNSWNGHGRAWKELLNKYLGIDDESAGAPAADERVRAAIVGILDRLGGLDAVSENVSLERFARTFQHWLERCALPSGRENVKGVAVMNAMAARGLSFRALFILGLNEGVFPRTIREDAFLRDREREIFERDLGYKVSQKLAAFDEEKLIFTLLAGAARERLYCLYQRADETGRVLAPSWYLDELKRAHGSDPESGPSETIIPRGIADKARCALFDRNDLLLPEELGVRLTLAGKDPAQLIESCDLSPNLYREGRRTVERLDLSSVRLDGFDGVVGPLPKHWDSFSKQGISPTVMETYARCPFQFFARHVLGLERLETPEDVTSTSPADFGELGHLILSCFYQELIDRNYFSDKASAIDIRAILDTVSERAFADYEAKNPVGYALAWESQRENLVELLRVVLAQDLEDLARSGYVPLALETEISEKLTGEWPEPLAGLTFRGRMDRIDGQPRENRLRVIDYKFKMGGRPSSEDKDLYRSALRGARLQPPFYCLLGVRFAAGKRTQFSDPAVEANFYYLAPRWAEGPLVKAAFAAEELAEKMGGEIKRTLAELTTGIRDGRFFIQPGDYCRHCEVSEICRKNHPPSLWRVENDPITRPHRELREKNPKQV